MLMSLAIAPVLILLFYGYVRDKYEKEPYHMLISGVIFGMMITFPIMFAGNWVTLLLPTEASLLEETFFIAFINSSLVEEVFKFLILYLLTWRNPNLNEPFDGIVYAVFISLGFAGVENVLYVLSPDLGGFQTAMYRGIFSVPGHGLFGVLMGYYYAKARFDHPRFLLPALCVPWLAHGVYNLLLIWDGEVQTVLFFTFFMLLIATARKGIKGHLSRSPFLKMDTTCKMVDNGL